MYCFACRMFGVVGADKGSDSWISKGVTGAKWKNAVKCIREHAATKYHLNCMVAWKNIEKQAVDGMLNEQRQQELSRRQQQLQQNREIVYRIMDIICFLAKQNLAFRGHRESESSLNRGNFLELVSFQAKHDPILKKHLEASARNCTYLSPEIQNELISYMGKSISSTIVHEVKVARYFTLLIDETTDTGHLEQVSFILRYVDSKCNIQERFLGMTTTDRTDAETLTNIVESLLKHHGLDIALLRGQGYDGAANMSGQYSGLQTRIREINSKAIFVHCYAHVLNLILVSCCTKNTFAKYFFGTVESLYVFIEGSSKRHAIFIKSQQDCGLKRTYTLKRLSDTRWSCRIDSLIALKSTLPAVLKTLEFISENEGTARIASEAEGLLTRVHSFKFVFSLIVFHEFLSYTKTLSDYLQSENMDFLSAAEMTNTVRSVLQSKRDEAKFDSYYALAQEVSTSLNVPDATDPPPPKRRRVSCRIDSAPGTQYHHDSAKDFYRIEFYYEVIDLMISGIDERFDSQVCSLLKHFSVLHPKRLFDIDWMSKLSSLSQFYADDVDGTLVKTEFEVFRGHKEVQNCESIQQVLPCLYSKGLDCTYPNVVQLYKICLTLPVTVASAQNCKEFTSFYHGRGSSFILTSSIN